MSTNPSIHVLNLLVSFTKDVLTVEDQAPKSSGLATNAGWGKIEKNTDWEHQEKNLPIGW